MRENMMMIGVTSCSMSTYKYTASRTPLRYMTEELVRAAEK